MADDSISQIPPGAYVYAIVVGRTVRYIGKGRGNRAWSHTKIATRMSVYGKAIKKLNRSRFYKRLAKAISEEEPIEVRILHDGLSDEEAFDLERYEIIGFRLGQLWNSAPGGEGLTSEYAKILMNTPEMKAVLSAKTKESWAKNPNRKDARFAAVGSRGTQSEMMKAKWRDPEYRAQQIASRSIPRPERRGKKVPALSEPAKKRWADQSFREKVISSIREAKDSDENRLALSKGLRASWANPDHRERRTQGLIKAWQNEKHREKMSEAAKARWADPEYRAKTVAARAARRQAQVEH